MLPTNLNLVYLSHLMQRPPASSAMKYTKNHFIHFYFYFLNKIDFFYRCYRNHTYFFYLALIIAPFPDSTRYPSVVSKRQVLGNQLIKYEIY